MCSVPKSNSGHSINSTNSTNSTVSATSCPHYSTLYPTSIVCMNNFNLIIFFVLIIIIIIVIIIIIIYFVGACNDFCPS